MRKAFNVIVLVATYLLSACNTGSINFSDLKAVAKASCDYQTEMVALFNENDSDPENLSKREAKIAELSKKDEILNNGFKDFYGKDADAKWVEVEKEKEKICPL